MKPLCIFRYAFGYSRTLDHLRAWQFVLPKSVKEVMVSLTMDGVRREEDIGTKLFIFENVPQLKYHNPHVTVTVDRKDIPTSTIRFTLEDGTCKTIETSGLEQKDIRQKITEHCYEQPPT